MYVILRLVFLNSFPDLETLSQLDALASSSNLQSLDLSENPVCKEDDFVQHMKKMLPKLTVLNGEDINN